MRAVTLFTPNGAAAVTRVEVLEPPVPGAVVEVNITRYDRKGKRHVLTVQAEAFVGLRLMSDDDMAQVVDVLIRGRR